MLGGWCNGHGRGAVKLRSAQWPLPAKGVVTGELGWRQPADPRVGTVCVVIIPPVCQFNTGLMQRGEQGLVQLLIAQLAVEALIGTCIFRQ